MDDPAWLDELRWRLRRVEPRQWGAALGALLLVALVGVSAWWWMAVRVRKPPSIFDAPVNDTLGFLALKDFSKLPVDQRVRFMLDFAARFRGMQSGESAAAAAFLAGLAGPAREQLRNNVRELMKDVLAEGAEGYMALPEAQRAAYIDAWLVKWQRTAERAVTGKEGDKSDEQRLADMRRDGQRGEGRRERAAGGGMVTDRGVAGFLDLWQGEVEPSSSPREQGQIVRFLDDVRTRMFRR
jgi:hypothetical protein